MKRKSLLVWAVLILLVSLAMAPGSAAARAIRVGFTGMEVPLGPPLEPGVWVVLRNGNVHVRGMVSQSQEYASDPLMSGVITVVMNANWGPDYAGPMWGTNESVLGDSAGCPGGGLWKGTWTGTMNSDESYSYRGVGQGISGCVEGLHYSLIAVNPGTGEATTYTGEILDPHGE